jgi:hypothetical protein
MVKTSCGRGLVHAAIATILVTVTATTAGAASLDTAQAAAAQPTIATPEDAKPFLGRWTTTFDSPQGAVTFDIEVHLDTGDPGATVSNGLIGEAAVSDVTKAGESLVLRYVAEVQGMQIPVSISLSPQGEALKADFVFMGGEYAASSVATRKK